MNINFWLNGVNRHAEISPDTLLIDFLRKQGCFSVKRGCETANCGLCTVLMDGRPVLSCSTLAARIEGKKIVTLEGMQREAQEFGSFLANEGAEQCGFCNPGFIMNVFAMLNEIKPDRRDDWKSRNSIDRISLTSVWSFKRHKKQGRYSERLTDQDRKSVV